MMKHQTRTILAGMLGNLVEAFDLAICGLLSVYLAKYLVGDSIQGLTIVFITFFAGFLARPIGAMVLGLLSDAYGRKITLAASILSMGITTTWVYPPEQFDWNRCDDYFVGITDNTKLFLWRRIP